MPHINNCCRASTKSIGDLVSMQKDGKDKSYSYNLEIILATEMGFLSSLKSKRIKTKNLKEKNTNFVDFHLEIANKVDEVINKNEKLENQQETKPEANINLVEIRKKWMKGPLTPEFKTDPQGNPIFAELNINEDLFEVEQPLGFRNNTELNWNQDRLLPSVEKPDQEECKNLLIEEEKQGSQKWLMGLGKIKLKSKSTPKKEIKQEKTTKTKSEKLNGYTTIKKDLENTKQELEKKKKEIEEIEKLAKQKEEELEKRKEERKKQEKLKMRGLKKQKKLEKIKEKKRRKEEKRLLAEQKKKEKLKLEQQLKKEKLLEEQKKKEKLEAGQQLKKEKLKQKEREKEEKRLLAEQKIKEKLEAKQQLKEELKKKETEKQVQIPEHIKDYDDLIETVAKKEIITDTKPQDKETEQKPEIKAKLTQTPRVLDEDVRKALTIIDNLLEKLPEETIEEFVNSKDFEIYEKVVNKYKNK